MKSLFLAFAAVATIALASCGNASGNSGEAAAEAEAEVQHLDSIADAMHAAAAEIDKASDDLDNLLNDL